MRSSVIVRLSRCSQLDEAIYKSHKDSGRLDAANVQQAGASLEGAYDANAVTPK
jgi:hypothetical protein